VADAPLVIASNRGPVELRAGDDGVVRPHRGSGGLIAVLGPAAVASGGVWVASAITEHDVAAAHELVKVDLPGGTVAVRLLAHEPDVYRDYYGTVATELLWFLHHHLPARAVDRSAWHGYRRVNHDFAVACARHAAPGGIVLVQDYHLCLVPRRLRRLRPDVRSTHFTMTPWAAPDEFEALPPDLRRELVDGILGADVACFLVRRWAEAFLECCARLGLDVDRNGHHVTDGTGRRTAVRWLPVGVDPGELGERMTAPDVLDRRRRVAALAGDRRLVVRVDRMEPAKNVLRGLVAYSDLLATQPSRRGRVVHLVLAYSSRGDLPEYRRYAEQVRALAAEINHRWGTPDWQPVVLETDNDFALGLAAMSLADVLVVNPLRDGMNLVAKEGPVVSEGHLALILSHHAGAMTDLADGCLPVDPTDVGALTAALGEALDLPTEERLTRLAKLRAGATALPPREWLRAALSMLEAVP
jgi:trehalose 6-phosphate synthase